MRDKKLFRLIVCAMLVAMAIVLKIVSITTPISRITLYDIPLMIAGMLFGPLWGGASGFLCDWVYSVSVGYGVVPSLYTIASVLWGLIPGLFFMNKKYGWKKTCLTVIVTSIMVTMTNAFAVAFDNSFIEGAFIFENFADKFTVNLLLPTRLIPLIIKWPIELSVLMIVYWRVWINMHGKEVIDDDDEKLQNDNKLNV